MDQYTTPPATKQSAANGCWSAPLWAIIGVVVGFGLPVAACGFLFIFSLAGFGALADSLDTTVGTGETGEPGVALLDLSGPIYQGSGLGAASDTLIRDIEWFEDNDDVEAILVMANSPGGEVNATDIVWQRLSQVQKPVVVSINGLCASGCYYIAMAADANEVYATPGSLIGSIGVISMFINVEELAADIGVEAQVITTGDSKDFGSPFRELTEEEIEFWEGQIAETLDLFVSRVDNGRPNLSESEVRDLASGRIWAATQARDLGLVDELRYPDEVMDRAADLAGLGSDYRVIESPYAPTPFELFLGDPPGLAVELPSAYDLAEMMEAAPLQYRYFGPGAGIGNVE